MKAFVFDIQRSSFVDGPGIRTTVFFKGCALRCKWCHSPESQSPAPQLMFYKEKCIGCKRCAAVCPTELSGCTNCGKCAAVCPSRARVMCGLRSCTLTGSACRLPLACARYVRALLHRGRNRRNRTERQDFLRYLRRRRYIFRRRMPSADRFYPLARREAERRRN